MSCKGINEPSNEQRENAKFLVVRDGCLQIVQGSKEISQLCFNDFFIEVSSELNQTFILPRGEELDICPGNMTGLAGEVQFIAFLVTYPEDILDEDQYIWWKYPSSEEASPAPSPDPDIRNLGKIMILSGTSKPSAGWDLEKDKTSPYYGGIKLINPNVFDVTVQLLIVN